MLNFNKLEVHKKNQFISAAVQVQHFNKLFNKSIVVLIASQEYVFWFPSQGEISGTCCSFSC